MLHQITYFFPPFLKIAEFSLVTRALEAMESHGESRARRSNLPVLRRLLPLLQLLRSSDLIKFILVELVFFFLGLA